MVFVALINVQNPPLYLHITSTSKDGLEKAVQQVEELMKQELPNLVDERRFRRREPDQVERDEFGRVGFPCLPRFT
jgi:predicted metallo-beta-lactamase superfamily hydrolase